MYNSDNNIVKFKLDLHETKQKIQHKE